MQGCICLYRKNFIFLIPDRGDCVFTLINTELSVALKAFHLSRVVFGFVGLCLTSSPSGLTLMKCLALLSLLFPAILNTQTRKALIAGIDQNHIIFHKHAFPFSVLLIWGDKK